MSFAQGIIDLHGRAELCSVGSVRIQVHRNLELRGRHGRIQSGRHFDRCQAEVAVDLTRRRVAGITLNQRATRRNQIPVGIQMQIACPSVELALTVFDNEETLALNGDVERIVCRLQTALREELPHRSNLRAQPDLHRVAGFRRSRCTERLPENVGE